jgi:hypothetical protein
MSLQRLIEVTKMKHLFLLIFFLFFLFPSSALAESKTTFRVYDKESNILEIWQKKDGIVEIYDMDWNRKGYIKKENNTWELYDKDWNRRGTVESEDDLFKEGP